MPHADSYDDGEQMDFETATNIVDYETVQHLGELLAMY